MVKPFSLLALAGATASAFMATPAQAITFFVDRDQFEAALENVQTEDFQSFTADEESNPFVTEGFTVNCNNTGSFDACAGGFFIPEIVDETLFLESQNPTRPPATGDLVLNVNPQVFGPVGATYTFSFLQPVVGFGFDLLAGDQLDNGDLLLTANGISQIIDLTNFDVPEQGFFGFVGHPGENFDSFTLAAALGTSGAAIGIDNLAFSTTLAEPEAVPEPASMLGLLTVGAVAAGGALKSKQAQA